MIGVLLVRHRATFADNLGLCAVMFAIMVEIAFSSMIIFDSKGEG
jgi:hypothetical protein